MTPMYDQWIGSQDLETRRKAALALAEEKLTTALPHLEVLLGDANWRVRKAAVESILSFPHTSTLPMLFKALYDPENAGKRNSAVEAIVKVGQNALPFIYDQLVEEDVDVKLALITLLGEITSRSSAPHLIFYLSHENVNVVSAAITSLGRLRDAGNLPVLFDLFQRPDDWLWFHLIDSLSNIGGPAATAKLMELCEWSKYRKAVLKAFGAMGDLQTVPFLLERGADAETPILQIMEAIGRIYHANMPEAMLARHRRELVRLIRQHFPMGLVDKLDAAWEEAKVPERRGMIVVAGSLSDLGLLDHVLSELGNPYLQRDAYEAANAFGQAAVPSFVQRLNAGPPLEQKLLLIRLLAAAGGSEVVVPLLNQACDDDIQIRMDALTALGEVNDTRCLQKLVSVLKETDTTFHETALKALQALSRKHPEHRSRLTASGEAMVREEDDNVRRAGYSLLAEGSRDLGTLIPGLKDPSPTVRQAVVRLVAQRPGASVTQTLLPMLGDESPKVRRVVISALGRELLSHQTEVLVTSLTDPDVWVRAETAFFLAQSTDPDVAEALLKVLEEDDLPVRLGALRGLAEVGCGILFDTVRTLASDDASQVEIRQAALAALAKSGRPDAVKALTQALADHRWEVRSTAIELMGSSHDRQFIPLLLKELERDQDPLVKQAVIHALLALKAIEAVPRMLNYLTDPALKDATYSFFMSLGKEHIRLIENEAKSVDFQTKLILIEILKHLENL
jgi:HEAT repeat protein